MKRRLASWIGLGLALALAGCAGKEAAADEAGRAGAAVAPKPPRASNEPIWTGEELVFLKEKFGELEHTASGLYYKVLQPGTGDERPARAKLCSVFYRGTFLDGRVFDERMKSPFKFRVGVGGVIKGWDEAVADMHKGEKRLIVVPYWLGYGAQGKIPYIMPRTTLVFEIELLDWESTKGIPVGSESN